MTPALDVACGPRSFYFDKDDPRVTFCDLNPRHLTLCDGRALDVEPDLVADFRDLPFADESFSLVVFDPPHLTVGAGWQVDKYGRLDPRGVEVRPLGGLLRVPAGAPPGRRVGIQVVRVPHPAQRRPRMLPRETPAGQPQTEGK